MVKFSLLFSSIEEFHFKPLRRYLIFVEDYYKLYRENLNHDTVSRIANIYYLKRALKAAETNRFWAHPSKSFAYFNYDWSNSFLNNQNKYPFRKSDPFFTKAHHSKYRELMKMRISFLLVKNYLKMASRYDKETIFWFNAENYESLPYLKKRIKKKHYLIRSLKKAEIYYKIALKYWNKCKLYVKNIWEGKYENYNTKTSILFRQIHLYSIEMNKMEDEAYKIYHNNDKRYKEEEKDYYINNPYPEYNYSFIINKKLNLLKLKHKKLNIYIQEIS